MAGDYTALEKLLAEKKPSLHAVDISWNKISTKNMTKLMQAIRSNYHIKSLNIAFNPFDKEDPLPELGNYIRQNANLQHLDLSGVLQTVEQEDGFIIAELCSKSNIAH